MLRAASSFESYDVEAADGCVGIAQDLLFDDITWRLRWLVVDTGGWLNNRRVLIHPSFIGGIDDVGRSLPVRLPRATIAAAPGIHPDRLASIQTETTLYDYYGWDPTWGSSVFGHGMFPSSLQTDMEEDCEPEPEHKYRDEYAHRDDHEADNGVDGLGPLFDPPDPHLCSLHEVTGYHIDVDDGSIGHLEDVLIDDSEWLIHYLVVNTGNWRTAKKVLISPYAVRHVDFPERTVDLNLTQDKIRASPAWDPAAPMGEAGRYQLHRHYDWPDY